MQCSRLSPCSDCAAKQVAQEAADRSQLVLRRLPRVFTKMSVVQSKTGDRLRMALAETLDRRSFIGIHFEYRKKLGDLKQIVHLFRQVQQFQLAFLAANRCEPAYQFADSRTVDIVDVAEVEQDFGLPVFEQIPHGLAQ